MTQWQRIKSAAGWGLFLGVCDWILASGITNKIPRGGVWAIVLGQTLLGVIVGLEKWSAAWWVKGLALGLAVNVALAFIVRVLGPEWGRPLFFLLIGAGAAIGLFIEWVMNRKSVSGKKES